VRRGPLAVASQPNLAPSAAELGPPAPFKDITAPRWSREKHSARARVQTIIDLPDGAGLYGPSRRSATYTNAKRPARSKSRA